MKTWEQVYKKWDNFQDLEQTLRLELDRLKEDPTKLEDAFYKEITFGTDGMCGEMGPGTNRMNRYTVRKTVKGLANYLYKNTVNVKDRGVVIAFDTRYMSKEFASEVAQVLGYYGIRSYLFEQARPTPLLSFAVRYLGATAGMMITANHHSPKYNGVKVYNEEGAQIGPEEVKELVAYINQTEDELRVPYLEKTELEEIERIYILEDEVDFAYLERLKYITRMDPETQEENKNIQIVFTPLHGTGLPLVKEGLKQLGFSDFYDVKEQAIADPEFRTVESPNPEEHQAFTLAMELGEAVNADILLATDPGAGRLGVAVKSEKGNYQVLTGNQLGSLLFDYIMRESDLNVFQSPRMIKSVVTTSLGRAIADSYKVETLDTWSGFKHIGEKIAQFDSTGETFMFGFEESNGYLVSGFVRDKDAIQASVMTAEMAYYWKKQGRTLLDVLEALYKKHGYYLEDGVSFECKGEDGASQIQATMNRLQNHPPFEIAGFKVEKVENDETREPNRMNALDMEPVYLPKEDMLKFHLENLGWVVFRTSEIEPKMKCDFGVRADSESDSKGRLLRLKQALFDLVEEVMFVTT